jgi:hypothetical protein
MHQNWYYWYDIRLWCIRTDMTSDCDASELILLIWHQIVMHQNWYYWYNIRLWCIITDITDITTSVSQRLNILHLKFKIRMCAKSMYFASVSTIFQLDFGTVLTVCVRVMVYNITFNNNSVISWGSVLLVDETGVTGENHRTVASHWQTLSHNVLSSTPRLIWIRTYNVSGNRYWLHR